MDKVDAIRSHYENRIHPQQESYRVLDWASSKSQQLRFRILADNVDLDGRSILDVGCGLGDLWGYLKRREIPAEYTGVDLLEEMLAEAARRHPGATFVRGDVFREPDPFAGRQFDVVFGSGIFNLNLGNNHAFLPRAISRLLELSREHVVFNLLHARMPGTDPTYAYYNPEEVRLAMEGKPVEYEIVDDYLGNDFTVICRKK